MDFLHSCLFFHFTFLGWKSDVNFLISRSLIHDNLLLRFFMNNTNSQQIGINLQGTKKSVQFHDRLYIRSKGPERTYDSTNQWERVKRPGHQVLRPCLAAPIIGPTLYPNHAGKASPDLSLSRTQSPCHVRDVLSRA